MWYCRIAKAHLLYGLALFVAVYALHAPLRAFVSRESPALTNRLTPNSVYVSPGVSYTFPDLEAPSLTPLVVFNREAPGQTGGLTGYGESTYWMGGSPRFHRKPRLPALP
jgi:hypothetical protein